MQSLCKIFIISVFVLSFSNCKSQTKTQDNAQASGRKAESRASNSALADQLKTIFDHYFAIKDALVKTDGALASTHALALVSSLGAIKMDELSKEEHTSWMKVEKNLKSDAERISETKDASLQRERFTTLSRDMAVLMKASKQTEKVYLQHCPMFNDGKGADWLSKESNIKNPYYGNKMLTCGKTVETIQ